MVGLKWLRAFSARRPACSRWKPTTFRRGRGEDSMGRFHFVYTPFACNTEVQHSEGFLATPRGRSKLQEPQCGSPGRHVGAAHARGAFLAFVLCLRGGGLFQVVLLQSLCVCNINGIKHVASKWRWLGELTVHDMRFQETFATRSGGIGPVCMSLRSYVSWGGVV